ncbi:alpha-hydroxy-acid oxidizing protein [Spirochaetota bacterium]
MESYKNKTIMIIGGGLLQVPAVKTAIGMGLKCIVTDYNKNAYGLKLADYPIVMSTKDLEGNVRIARMFERDHHPIDGIITVGTDASMTVAAVANALSLPGIKYDDAEAATNKIKMRKRFAEHNVPQPDFKGVWNVHEAIKATEELSYPLVIKPADNMGARGVRRIDSEEELYQAFPIAKGASPSGDIIIEEYMKGPELSIDALIYNGEIFITGVADRIIEFPPYFVETGHIMPSSLSGEQLHNEIDVFKKGIKALGITIGAAKGDIKITEDGARVGEIAARLSGGFMSAYTYPYATGVNLIKNAIEIALGHPPSDLEEKYSNVSVERAIIAKPGRITSIEGIEKANKIKGVKNIFLKYKIGDEAIIPTNNIEKGGNVIAVGNSRDEAMSIAEKALSGITIKTTREPVVSYREVIEKAKTVYLRTERAEEPFEEKIPFFQYQQVNRLDFKEYLKPSVMNRSALERLKIQLSLIHNIKAPSTEVSFLGSTFSHPVFAAPIPITQIEAIDSISIPEYICSMVEGMKKGGGIAFLSEGYDDTILEELLRCINENDGIGIPVLKSSSEADDLLMKIEKINASAAAACCIDINIASYINSDIRSSDKAAKPKSLKELIALKKALKKPLIIKGILTKEDAVQSADIGADIVYISNQGTFVMDSVPGSVEVLHGIYEKVHKHCKIMIDGGIRSGIDIFKVLALGADYVAIGRPFTVACLGGNAEGVRVFCERYKSDLEQAMLLTGAGDISSIKKDIVRSI